MDQDRIQRKQSVKLIVSEVIMVFAVIATVVVLAFLVSGYWLNANFEVERQGMLQINSSPTGANVLIDGESSWLQRTNTSKVLPSGEHTVTLTKEEYDSWTKTVNISEGLLYKIHYPRLFLKNREIEKVYSVSDAAKATISPDRTKLLLINNTSNWSLVDLEADEITPKKIEIKEYFSEFDAASGLDASSLANNIKQINWSKDNNHILFRVDNQKGREWVILDISNLTNSINLTTVFGADFSEIKMLNDSASNLLITQNGNLRKIDIQAKQISAILAENVLSFDHHNNEVVLVTKKSEADYEVDYLKLNNDELKKISSVTAPSKIVMSMFYDNKYITILTGTELELYLQEDFSLVSKFDLTFAPASMKVGHASEFLFMRDNTKIATLDMEAMKVREWTLPSEDFGWIDDDMIYDIYNGELFVFDFDGLNQRSLAKNVTNNWPVAITGDKWMYYFSNGKLVREWLIPR